MPLVTELELPVFDYSDPSTRGERFHATMRELRERSWLAASPLGTFVLDREAVSFFLRSRTTEFPGMLVAQVFGVTEGPLYEEIANNILCIHGADHGRLRQLVNPAFTPRAADRWRPYMRRYLEDLFAPLAEARRCELVATLAKPYPALMIATVMGAPLEDAPRLHEWSNWIQRQFSADLLDQRDRIEAAAAEFADYAAALLEQRKRTPGEDLISQLAAAEEAGDRLSDVECVHLVTNVLVGGVDTTQSQLAHALRLFAEHPDQWALLAEQPELAPAAVDEVARFEPIVPFTARVVVDELEYRGVTFPKDTIVVAAAVTANRDPEAYDEPEEFDITADRERAKPLTFGAGPHFCLGANLARAELQEAFALLAPRMPELELAGDPVYDTPYGVYGMKSLPVRWRL